MTDLHPSSIVLHLDGAPNLMRVRALGRQPPKAHDRESAAGRQRAGRGARGGRAADGGRGGRGGGAAYGARHGGLRPGSGPGIQQNERGSRESGSRKTCRRTKPTLPPFLLHLRASWNPLQALHFPPARSALRGPRPDCSESTEAESDRYPWPLLVWLGGPGGRSALAGPPCSAKYLHSTQSGKATVLVLEGHLYHSISGSWKSFKCS